MHFVVGCKKLTGAATVRGLIHRLYWVWDSTIPPTGARGNPWMLHQHCWTMPCFKQVPENGIGSDSHSCGGAWEEKGWGRGLIKGQRATRKKHQKTGWCLQLTHLLQSGTSILPLQKCKQAESMALLFFCPYCKSEAVTTLGHVHSALMQLLHAVKIQSLLVSAIKAVLSCRKLCVTYYSKDFSPNLLCR